MSQLLESMPDELRRKLLRAPRVRKVLESSRALDESERAYVADLCSTPEGRRSFELRKRATELVDSGRAFEAHDLFLQAAAQHPDTDTSAEAGATWHDLGKSWMDLEGFLPEERFRQAELFLRRAAACPGRRKYPYWQAMTLSMLASCLRYQAGLGPYDSESAEDLLDEAERVSQEAVDAARGVPKVGHFDSARYLLNLGNLREQRGKWDGAVEAYEQGLEEIRLFHRSPPRPGADEITTSLHLQLAHVLALRRGRGDQKRALQLVGEVARHDPSQVNEAWLLRAEILAGDPARREDARDAIRKVDPGRLRPDLVSHLAGLLKRLDLTDEALALLRRLQREAMQRRTDAITDHDADYAALDAQHAALLAAEILVDRGEAISAFMELENVSGLRFLDAVHMHDHRPEDPVTRELWRRKRNIATLASYVGTVAGLYRNLRPEEQRQMALHSSTIIDPGDELTAPLAKIFDEAAASPYPADTLQRAAEELTEQTYRALHALEKHATGSDRADLAGVDSVGKRELERILSEEDTVLVRLHLAEDLLVVSVWLAEGRLTGRSARLDVPEQWWNLVSAALQDPKKADAGAWTELLASLDLSPVLPTGTHRRVVLLPSYVATFLPLAALGPVGRRPVDLFRSVIWLPTLAPLMRRQVPFRPRLGTLTVVGDEAGFAEVATRLKLPGERRLEGDSATPENVMDQARTADVISFFAHGSHAAPEEPYLRLHGKHRLDRGHLLEAWEGAERVELWACQSGVNISLDPRTPAVDEAFGFDIEFIRVGVRTTIGTLWKVPSFVTACLVHRFRKELLQGCDGAEALAAAQRWWNTEGLPTLIESLRSRPPKEGFRAFIASLGAECREADLEEMLSTLGPLPAAPAPTPETELDRVRARLECPLSWAGFRFHGIPERRPLKPWKEEYDQPASEEIRREVDRLLQQEEEKAGESRAVEDMVEEGLRGALAENRAHPGAPPLSLLRLYPARQCGAHADNLLFALARIHDGLLDPSLDAGQRTALVTEAAHLWLDFAQGELPHLLLVALHAPPPVALFRAARLLEESMPAAGLSRADRVAAQARLLVMRELAGASLEREKIEGVVRRAWALLEPGMGGLNAPVAEAMRVATVICEVLRLAPGAVEGAAPRALSLADSMLKAEGFRSTEPIHLAPLLARLWDARDELAHATERQQTMPEGLFPWLPPRALARALLRRLVILAEAGEVPDSLTNTALGHLEQAFWGYPSDRVPALRSTGAPGFAYRWALASYLRSLPDRPRTADHFIACVQFACDPRLGLQHRLARIAAWRRDPELGRLWSDLRQREHLAESLREAALLPGFQVDPTTGAPSLVVNRLDPFALDAKSIQSAKLDITDLIFWELADRSLLVAGSASPPARTAALQAVEQIERLGEEVVRRGTPALTARPPLIELYGHLQDLEGALAKLPQGHGMVAMMLGQDGTPMAAALWHGSEGRRSRVLRGEAGHLGVALASVLATQAEDDRASTRGRSAQRREAWEFLQRHAGPFLAELLASALGERLHWRVLAPGALRPLPWLGFSIGGERLFQKVASLRLLPSLGYEVPLPPFPGATGQACLLAPVHDEGDTTFGEAVIATLRRASPPEIVLDSDGQDGRNVIELVRLGQVAPRIRSVRLYGVGSVGTLTPTTAALVLTGKCRLLAPRNLLQSLLPGCEEVQLWAATSGRVQAMRAAVDDGDALPGLAKAFIAAGARGVLDLAWPVPDLLKALVCEQHGLARLAGAPGAEALCRALERTREILASWATEARRAGSVEEALAQLDERRRAALSGLLPGGDASPFAALHGAPSVQGLTASELVAEMLEPSHLAAFRWWGD